MASGAATWCFLRNGKVLAHAADASAALAGLVRGGAFVASAPQGVYTTARTVNRTSVFNLDAHAARIVAGAAPTDSGAPEALKTLEGARNIVKENFASALEAFGTTYPDVSGECKLSMVVAWRPHAADVPESARDMLPFVPPFTVYTWVGPFGHRSHAPCKVLICGRPRQHADIKDTAWTRARKPLEELKRDDLEELLLMDTSGHILEGSQTNFYVVKDGALYTADHGILPGTVRPLVLAAADELGIPVVLTPPNVLESSSWQAALLSSTSRWALPVQRILALKSMVDPLLSNNSPAAGSGSGSGSASGENHADDTNDQQITMFDATEEGMKVAAAIAAKVQAGVESLSTKVL